MPANIEVKARVVDIPAMAQLALALPAKFAGVLHQIDTYFHVTTGRLKLREVDGLCAELIFYEREESAGRRHCEYTVVPVPNQGALKSMLGRALGIRTQVEKTRRLYLYGTSRIHLDEVCGLGRFIEFEVPVERSEAAAREEISLLTKHFNLEETALLRGSYGELAVNGELEGVRVTQRPVV